MFRQQTDQSRYTLNETEQKTKPYLQHLPDDPGGLSYEELLKLIEQYHPRSETNQEDLAKSFAGLRPADDASEAIPILDELIETDYQDAMTSVEDTKTDEQTVGSSLPVEDLLDESIEFQSELAVYLSENLESARRKVSANSDVLAVQTELLETLEGLVSDRELKRFIRAWRQGNPLTKARYQIDLIQEYCRKVFSELPPDQALSELIAIREHYGDENDNMYGQYRIGRMIAGCHAALGQFDETQEVLRSTAHESFEQMRRYTDFCLAFGFYEDLIEFVKASVGGERHLTGGYATAQMIMAYRMLGRIDDALPHLKARVNVRVRDQQLIDNIWSLKLRTGERPTGSEILSVQRSNLRTFGKKNMGMVADTLDALLEVYLSETGKSLLHSWSEQSHGSNYVCKLHLISIPGLLNPCHALPNVKEHNLRYYIEIDVQRYSFIDSRSVKAFMTDVTRLAEDFTKAAGRAICAVEIDGSELRTLLRIEVIRTPEAFDLEAVVPAEFHAPPLVIDIDYRPPGANIDRFKELAWLIPQAYAQRDTDPDAIGETIRLCEEQIALRFDVAHFEHLWWRYTLAQRKRNSVRYEHDPEYLEHYLDIVRFGRRKCVGFERLAIILEKQGEHEAALRCVVKAKAEGWPGAWEKRILRLVKKVKS